MNPSDIDDLEASKLVTDGRVPSALTLSRLEQKTVGYDSENRRSRWIVSRQKLLLMAVDCYCRFVP
jgi:hypothetical protein